MGEMCLFLLPLLSLSVLTGVSEGRRLEVPGRLTAVEENIAEHNDTILNLLQETEQIASFSSQLDDVSSDLDDVTSNVAAESQLLADVSEIVDQLKTTVDSLNSRVEVAATVNLAYKKQVEASSYWDDFFTPDMAVDGSPVLDGFEMVCYASGDTYWDPEPWWQVDLQGHYPVSEVHVYARDDYEPWRLHDITIMVSDDRHMATWALCGTNNTWATYGENVITTCADKPTGRYLRITTVVRYNYDLLQFCEVRVFS